MTRTPALIALLLVTSSLALVPGAEAASPFINSVDPSEGTSNGGKLITIDGTDFAEGAVVEIGTPAELGELPAKPQFRATNVTLTGTTKITANVPPHAAGAVTVRVRNPDGQAAGHSGLFSYTVAGTPTVSSVSSSVVPSNGGTQVTINGQNFDPNVRTPLVKFGDIPAVVLGVTATQITAVAPGHAPGIVGVSVTFPGAPTGACTGCFQYSASARPTVLSVTPTGGPKSGGTPVTISGTDFAPGTQVVFDGGAGTVFDADEFAAQVIFSTATQITAIAPAQPANAASVVKVRIVNPGAFDVNGAVVSPGTNSHVSDEDDVTFTYAAATSSPTLAAANAATPSRGLTVGGTEVTLTGTNFHMGANEEPMVLVFPAAGTACSGTGQAATVVSRTATTLKVEMPPLAAGSADVRVINPDNGGASACKEDAFTYVAPLAIHGLSATEGPTAGGTSATPGTGTITITGEGFMAGATVTFLSDGEAPRALVGSVSGTSMVVTPPPHKAVADGVTVVVTNPDGRSATFYRYLYVNSPAATLAGVSGTATSNGGETLTISGTGFQFGQDPDGVGPLLPLKPKVTIGDVVVPAKDVTGDPGVVTSFTVKAPAQKATSIAGNLTAPTKLNVAVANPDGQPEVKSDALTATNDQAQYAKAAAPTAAASPLSATTGPTYGGTLVVLSGSNFATLGALPTVTVGGTGATVIGTPSATEVIFLAPALTGLGPSENKDVVLTNPDEQKVTIDNDAKDFDFAQTGAPTVTGLSPSSGLPVGGTVVTITGTNLGTPMYDSDVRACTGAPNGVPTPPEFDGTKAVGPIPTVTFDNKPAKVLCIADGPTDSLVVVTPSRSGTGAVQVVVKAANDQSVTASQTFSYSGVGGEPDIPKTGNEFLLPVTGGIAKTLVGTGFGPVTRDLDGRDCDDAGFDKAKLATPVPTVRFVATGDANPGIATDVCVRELPDGADQDTLPDGVVLDVTAPPHAAGSVNVQVVNPDGFAGVMGGGVRYLPLPPILAKAEPASVGLNGGKVEFTGRNLPATAPFAAVLVRGAAQAVGDTVSSTDTKLTAHVPAQGAPGAADALAVDLDGQSGTLNDGLSYGSSPAPVFNTVSVRTGSLGGNTNITVTGSGFARGATVTFGGAVVEDSSVWDGGKKVSFETPNFMEMPPVARRLSPADVVILNPAALFSNPDLQCPGDPRTIVPGTETPGPPLVLTNHCLVLDDLFGYSTVVSPVIDGINPTSGAPGTTVTITGSNFGTDSTVRFGTVAVATADVAVVSQNTLTAKAPQGTGTVTVFVVSRGQTAQLTGAFTYTVTSSTTTTTSGTTTSRSTTTTSSSGTTTGPTGITAAAIEAANERIAVEVARDGDANVVRWELPTSGLPGTVAGIQVWGSNSPYSLLQTCASGSSCFGAAEFRHTGADAREETKYLVTMFYGTTQALGFFTQSTAPDTEVYPGTSSEDSGGLQGGDGDGGGLPNWAIVLIVLGVLFLVVLAAILIARGRKGSRQQAAAQGYAWEETPAAEAQAADAEWDGDKAGGEVHQARCPACATTFTATGSKPIVTVCPGCGKKGILR